VEQVCFFAFVIGNDVNDLCSCVGGIARKAFTKFWANTAPAKINLSRNVRERIIVYRRKRLIFLTIAGHNC